MHDLERLRVAPYRLVLSACESGVLPPVGADELLGLASALFSGSGLPAALLAARRAAQGVPTREATAAAFLALGV